MKLNKKGAALMQVLLITIILAGIATMILRATLSRTSSARRTRRAVSAQVLIQTCMAEVNSLWSKKTPEAFRRDLQGDDNGPYMYCTGGPCLAGAEECPCPKENRVYTYTCTIDNPYGGDDYKVRAYFEKDNTASGASGGTMWQLVYEIEEGSDAL